MTIHQYSYDSGDIAFTYAKAAIGHCTQCSAQNPTAADPLTIAIQCARLAE